MSEHKIIVGITQGDINGIGLEVALKTLMEPGIADICTPVLFSSQKTVSYYRKVLGIEDFNFNPIRDFSQLNTKKVNVFICYEEEVNIEMGKSTPTGGKYAFISLERATQALLDKQINVLVTAPINKNNIQSEDFKFVGHTEYLGAKLGGEPLMILCSENGLRVALVTGHLPVKDVASHISVESVSKKIKQLHQSLVTDFGIRKPRIAVLGLNPHAGDNGVIGTEDNAIIKQAIESTKLNAILYGPYAADGFFGNGTYKQFDGVLAMYHDQGLIPFKTISFNEGVNFTAGLSEVRTSPDHGTAYDIAGKNIASEQSFKQAIYRAIDIYRNRQLQSEITENPLPFGHLKKER
ncbi:MAG: 4-hydroxythreonine-4-phosphate dehydrogenase PdxA [Bacteroidia bacterium]|nr:4-hydroxythreonine-4-phosphate dehydrogenase PdxA [Bacteroidia bacterium]